MAAIALAPVVARAGCPCGADEQATTRTAAVPATQPLTALRVCADPNNLPFSDRLHEGFEDKIAALLAADLGLRLEYDWLPQRLGFYRTALKTFDSHLVMAAPAGFGKALVTDPYYRSTYVFVQRADDTPINGFDDPRLGSMKIGIQLTGGETPAAHALARRKIIDNVTGYPVFDESKGKPAERIVAAVASGEIDVAIVWGPQAGYFVKQQTPPLRMMPVTPGHDDDGAVSMPFTFEICMAVRRSDDALRKQLNSVIANRRKEIDEILDEFSVPRLAMSKTALGKAS